MSESSALSDRVTQLEECFSHQEHLVEQLNKVVIQLRLDLERVETKFDEQQRHIKWLTENQLIIDDQPDEKPPHY